MIVDMTGKRDAHERLPELIAAAVRVFTREGYRLARMSDVAAEMGLSEAAIYRYVGSKEGLFVLAIRHALLLEDLPAGDLPLSPAPLAATVAEARDFIAEVVPFGALAEALSGPGAGDTAAEFEKILRELFELESRTREAADMLERSARELPEMADLLNAGIRAPVLAALTEYLAARAEAGTLRRTPDTAATARLVLETLTWFARHRFSDPDGAAIPVGLAADTAVDALVHALVPASPASASAPGGCPVTGDAAVHVAGLRMSFGATEVLHGIDFDVRYGEVFCLLGPNGAGKTTTLEILEGFTAQTDGHVSVLGMNPAAQPARLRERAGMVLQECGFPRQARVAELIDLWRSYYPNPRPLGDLLEVVELTEVRNTQVRKLSGGQRRRLDFALALAGDPDLVFLDEPTTGFDPEARRRCWAAIENLRRLGKTVLLTTHYLDEAEQLADRIAILRAGRIELAGTTHEVAARAGLATRISFTTPSALRRGQVPLPDGVDLSVRGPESVCHTGNAAMTLRTLLDWARQNSLGDLDGLAVTAPRLEDTYLQLTTANGDRA